MKCFRYGFLLITYSDIKNYSELWEVNIVEETVDFNGVHHEKGDLILSLNNNGNPCYYRLLRRMPNLLTIFKVIKPANCGRIFCHLLPFTKQNVCSKIIIQNICSYKEVVTWPKRL